MSKDADLRNIVADVAAAYFRKSHVTPSEIRTVISQIATSLASVGAPAVELTPARPAQPKLSPGEIRKSISRDALISFEDGKPYRTLRRHLAARGLSPDEYRSKWGLPADYPMVAAAYREARAGLAKAGGFGRRSAVDVAAPEPEASAATPEPEAETALGEPAAQPISPEPRPVTRPVAAAPRPGLGARLGRKSATAPTAFRPTGALRDAETSTRHERWLAMLSEADWARIRVIARQVNHAHVPPALTDLSAPLRVRMCLVGQAARFAGEQVGTLREGQVAVLISEREEP